jgi:IK cytokine
LNSTFKKPFGKKKGNDDDENEDDEDSTNKINYRDRAAERRQQGDEPSDDSQLSTEELLKRTQAEVGDELDAKRLYEQSKYLGGDVQHTHLVKGLDFALLRKVRTDLEKKQSQQEDEDMEEVDQQQEEEEKDEEEEEEDDLDSVLEKYERGEKIQDDTTAMPIEEEDVEKPKFHAVMAKNIYDQIVQQGEQQQRVELFEPGRMAFVFELADEVGHYSDAFAIPTAMIRSKADVAAKLSKSGGWSEETQAETKLVIDKISQVMEAVRRGDRGGIVDNKVGQKKTTATAAAIVTTTSQPIAVVEDMFMGDIFSDVGRDYALDESSSNKTAEAEKTEAADTKKNYFQGLVEEEEDEDEEMADASHDAVDALLSQATGGSTKLDDEEAKEEEPKKKRKYNQVEMDADANDIDMFGLSSSALPTSFEEGGHHTAYQSDDDEEKEASSSTTQFIDQGTNKNKKAQLTRWDFDTEEEWQNYKSSIEITPKSAVQFGVKLGDGRKRNRERKGLNDKQRLDRDYQQVKNIMSKKYGKNV